MRMIIKTAVLALILGSVSCGDATQPGDGGWSVTEDNAQPDQTTESNNDVPDDSPDTTPDTTPDTDPDPDIDPDKPDTLRPVVSAAFVSGHLGNYLECPQDGYSDRDAGGADGEGRSFGACEPDADGCGILNCEGAQLTIQVTNNLDIELSNITIDELILRNKEDREVATLPILGVVGEDGSETPHTLGAGDSMLLRIDYEGPSYPRELLDNEDGTDSGFIDIIINADEAEPYSLPSTQLHPLPQIVT